MYDLRHYIDPDGQDLFAYWLDRLQDRVAQARVAARLLRLQNGNFGDCKPVGSGVWELRVDWGSGYRVYYAIAGKRTQAKDIERALQRWVEWQTRSNR